MDISQKLTNFVTKYRRLNGEISEDSPLQLLRTSIGAIPQALVSSFSLLAMTAFFIYLWAHASSESVFWVLIVLYPIVMIAMTKREISTLEKQSLRK